MLHKLRSGFLTKELGSFPYKLQPSTSLTENHKMRRKSFPQYFQRELRNDAGYLENISFSNECKFFLFGSVNKQNYRIWGSERPKEVYQTLLSTQQVIVWCALSEKEIIGLTFFEDRNLTGTRYKRTLEYFLLLKLREYPERMVFQ